VVRDSRNTEIYYSERNYFKDEVLKLFSFYRLPRALFLFLDEKKQKSRAAEKKAKNISSCVK
jgi:hypothetical protein